MEAYYMSRKRETSYFNRRRTVLKLQLMVVVISGVISLQWVIFQVIEYFFWNGYGKNNRTVGIAFVAVAIAFTSVCVVISRIKDTSLFKKPLKRDELNVYKAIIDRAMYDIDDDIFLSLIYEQAQQEKWAEVIRIGEVSSTLFWKMARYDLRISTGNLMIQAIDKLLKKEDSTQISFLKKKRASVLIDDLGYTYVGKNDFEKAEENITAGLQLAKEIKTHDLICKAYRHLSGILLQQAEKTSDESERDRFINEARSKYQDSKKELKWIFNPFRKIELSASLHYLLGRIFLVEKNYSEAINEYQKAKRRFEAISDFEHQVKVFYQIGLAYECSNHNPKLVVIQYETGYNEAVKLVDNEQILKNGCALCHIYSEEQDEQKFLLYYHNSYRVATALKNEQIIKDLRQLKQKLNTQEVIP